MLQEILNQPKAWGETISLLESRAAGLRELANGVEEAVFTGCGSGLNAAEAMAPTFQALTGVRARAVPAAEIVFFPESVLAAKTRTLVVAISRSGSTTETVKARDTARGMGMRTLAVTCHAGSGLDRGSTQSIVLAAADEASVTTTQSLTSMVLCGQLLAGIVADNAGYLAQLRKLPALGEPVVERAHDMGRRIGGDAGIRKFAFVASGPLRGLAKEAQLKIKEMVLLPSDAYPLLDYRHGPKSNVDPGMLVTVLSTDRTREVEAEFLAEMRGLKGRLLLVCDTAGPGAAAMADHVAETGSGLSDLARGVLYMPIIHFIAYYKSLAEGQSPSTPKNLTYWVETAGIHGG
jgi:glutamine---fructose-6-phosphate transaminase (isomerizing)